MPDDRSPTAMSDRVARVLVSCQKIDAKSKNGVAGVGYGHLIPRLKQRTKQLPTLSVETHHLHLANY